jgi:hypothetical protein
MAVTFIRNLQFCTTVLKSFNLAAKRPASSIIFVKITKNGKMYTKTGVQFLFQIRSLPFCVLHYHWLLI